MSSTQKVIKYLAIAFAILLIISITTGIYRLGYFVLDTLNSNETEEKFDINDFDEISKILNVKLKASKLIIKYGKKLSVESSDKNIKIEQKDNKLSVTQKNLPVFKYNRGIVVKIIIPSGLEFDEVYIENSAGTTDIEEIISKNLNLDMGAGKTVINSLIVTNKTNINTGAGETIISKAKIKNLNLDMGVGKLSLNAILYGKSMIEGGIGKIDLNLLDKKENYLITADTGIGSIKADGTKLRNNDILGNGENKISIKGGIGSINVKFKN